MQQFNTSTLLTDQLERRLIQQEIQRQMSFAPVFSFKRIAAKFAALFGSARQESTLGEARTAH